MTGGAGPAELWVVRHGRTEANAAGLLLGRRDVGLDDLGRAQAAALAAALPRPDLVISSPLRRAQETATAFGLPVELDELWIELDYGEWDGRPVGGVADSEWAAWRADRDFSPPAGESLARLTARVHDALDALAETADGRRIVVVTHVSPVKAALAWVLGTDLEIAWRCFVAPAAAMKVVLGPAGPSLHTFNDTSPLDGVVARPGRA